jgi:DNA polymerase III subunit alpha
VSFVHLSVHSEYSLHDSLLRVKPLFDQANKMGMPALAVTDNGNMYAAIKAYKGGLAKGVKPIMGAEITIKTPRLPLAKLTLLCKDNTGYRNLCEIISRGYGEAQRDNQDRPIIPLEWLHENNEGLIALSGGREGEIGRLLLSKRDTQEALADMHALFGEDFFLELQRIGHPADERYVREAVELAANTQTPVVATNPARFMKPSEFTSHELRLAISQGRSVKLLREELNAPCTEHQYFKSPDEMKALFQDIPSAIENTVRIAAKCSVDLTLGKNFLPNFPSTGGLSENDFLEKTSREGLEERLKFYFKDEATIAQHRKEYEDRLEFELKTIKDMGFPGYFLIVADFIRWAKANDIPVGPGRGSGAGSLVAYALGITDINPLPYALLFERFLNPERVSMPDFDVDFCMDKRDQVIQYVADTYGHNAVSQIITFGTMAARMVVKDVARALGHPYRFGDSISKMIPKRPDIDLETAMEEVPGLKLMYETDNEMRIVWDHALALEGLSRQRGKHAGGVLISPSNLTDFTPTECEPNGSAQISQFDKDDVETVGLVKFDFLGLRNLTIIDNAIKSVNARRKTKGEPAINILDIPLDDSASYALLQSCETTAVFQLESAGMKNLIKSLRPDRFEDIIALVALFRPGPLQSGMVDDFVNRKHGRSEVTYPHPLLENVLKPTYGVIVYQEQVMQIAQVLAGYSLGGADMLRRAMGKKKPEEMQKQRSIFVDGCAKNGIDGQLAESIFALMEKFAEYGFNKSHSAAYALVAYQTAWLKAHHPADFMAAVLSSDMDNTDKVVRFIHECRSMNLVVNPPNINLSDWNFTAHKGEIIYGLGAIKGLGDSAAREILDDRKRGGPYENMVDFLYRNPVRKTVAEACIHAGLFDFTGMDRAELLATYPMALAASKQMKKQTGQGSLFDFVLPPAPRKNVDKMEVDIRLNGERKVLGLYLTGHPYARYAPMLKKATTGSLAQILTNAEDESLEGPDKWQSVTFAGLISDVDVRSNTRGNYAFFKVDDNTARIDCAIFTKAYHDYQTFIKDDNLVVMKGWIKVNPKNNSVSLTIDMVQPLQSFLENQPGQMIITLNDKETPSRVMGLLHASLGTQDEGNITFGVKAAADGEVTDLPVPGVSYASPSIRSLLERFGERATIEYRSVDMRRQSRKQASDIQPVANVEDLEAMKSSLRKELERYLSDAESIMARSVEMTP